MDAFGTGMMLASGKGEKSLAAIAAQECNLCINIVYLVTSARYHTCTCMLSGGAQLQAAVKPQPAPAAAAADEAEEGTARAPARGGGGEPPELIQLADMRSIC